MKSKTNKQTKKSTQVEGMKMGAIIFFLISILFFFFSYQT